MTFRISSVDFPPVDKKIFFIFNFFIFLMYEIFSKELLKTLIKSIFCFDKNLKSSHVCIATPTDL